MPSKSDLRREMRTRVRTVGQERGAKSQALCAAIAEHPSYQASRTIGIFDPLPGEPQIDLLWNVAPKRFVYPRIEGEELLLLWVESPAELRQTAPHLGFREPLLTPERLVEPREVDLILVPGLAFTRDGRRMGRGGGFYDRLLVRIAPQAHKLGICFDVQILENLPTEPHDQKVEAVITESGLQVAPGT